MLTCYNSYKYFVQVSKHFFEVFKIYIVAHDDKTKDELKVGDKVLFSKYAGTEVELEREKFIVLKYQDLLAVVK